ncbi:probable endonuclease 4 isoform X3 [Polyodon spathula]|uniref:probable endonuclease 4 isoform X3 n=1 Tax=Polyodon spathula TaxID=7913 RepID=UPI001B7E87BC|nr:probable endonuclease 4 isoform X3 [Polyodon spathula]
MNVPSEVPYGFFIKFIPGCFSGCLARTGLSPSAGGVVPSPGPAVHCATLRARSEGRGERRGGGVELGASSALLQVSWELEGSAHSVRPVLTPKRKKGQVTLKEGEGNRGKEKASRQRRKSVKRGVKRESVDGLGGLWNAVRDSVTIGGCVFGMFLGSQRSWKSRPLDEKAVAQFRQACSQHGFTPDRILPHGSYLLNCGSPKPDVYEKSRAMLIDELKRCEQLGLTMFNFHPGSTLHDITVEECLDRIADSINHAHQHTTGVTTVIENMSCQGNTVGGKFSELRGIIDRVKDKSRVGVCLDTCHAFAAGHDLSAVGGVKKMLDEFDWTVGLQYLKAVHLNDSKGKLGCHLDRHENIGEGEIGLEGFRQIMNEPRLDNMPMILETPVRPDMDGSQEIQLLYSLCQ